MADYKESTATGKVWQRCYRVIIENARVGTPNIAFAEEEVVDIGGKTVSSHAGYCNAIFDAAAGTIAMVDPTTNLPTGTTVSHAELYAILYSLYLQTATQRDAVNT